MDYPLIHCWWSSLNEAATYHGTKSAKSVRILDLLPSSVHNSDGSVIWVEHVENVYALSVCVVATRLVATDGRSGDTLGAPII